MKNKYLKPVIVNAKNEKPLILPRRVSAEKIAYIPKRNWLPIYISLVLYILLAIPLTEVLDTTNPLRTIWEFKWTWFFTFLVTLYLFIIPFFKDSRAEELRGPLFILDRQAGTFSYTDNAQQEHIYDFKHIKIREGANPMLYYTK
ncbi:MAG: hypothetical protein OIF50_02410, partial [Flavobacteriaceae bacterium]|nr:hypothetical protein [Flavobacteriaceae bacterium]